MKRISAILVLALLAACGSDSKVDGDGGSGGGGAGGTGGTGTTEAPVVVENDAGRTFVGDPMTIVVTERSSGGATIMVEMITNELEEDGIGFYEVMLMTTGDYLIDGEMVSTVLSTDPPINPGVGIVQVGFSKGDGEFAANTDRISFLVDGGTFTGSVTSSKPEVGATFAGEYTLSCSALDGAVLVPDPAFSTAFCQQFAHQLPAD